MTAVLFSSNMAQLNLKLNLLKYELCKQPFGNSLFFSRDGDLGDPKDGCSTSRTSVIQAPHWASTASAGKRLLNFRKMDLEVFTSI